MSKSDKSEKEPSTASPAQGMPAHGMPAHGMPSQGTPAQEWSFEQALKRLEELVRRLEQGNIPLEQSLAEYSEAVELLRVCQAKLEAAQCRVEVLSGFDADGVAVSRPLSIEGDMTLDEKRDARSSRRSAGPQSRSPRTDQNLSDVDETGQLF
jgi:exodeoxyribonuclease VII small subunit